MLPIHHQLRLVQCVLAPGMLFDQIVTLPFNTLKGLLNIARFLPHIIQLPFFNGELICDDGYRSQDICIVLAGNARFSTRCIQIVDLVLQLTNLFGLLINQTILLYQSTNSSPPIVVCFRQRHAGSFFSYFVDLTGVFLGRATCLLLVLIHRIPGSCSQHHQTRHAANQAKRTTHQASADRCYAIEIALSRNTI
ncbi:Uncharacterised protein [Enterobacter hormaechei]|nr:Uncharacterised protein [Enterobacter hormaechei]